MSYTTINKSSLHMNTKIYTGDSGTNNSITGIGFKPDMVWLKNRTGSGNHFLWDVVRGANKTLVPNDTDTEATSSYLGSFDTDGFTLTSASNNTNSSSYNYVGWNWKANGAGSANTDGSISSTVSVNATSGFSIVKYTGNGTGNSTIGHGLGATPKFIIVKCISATQSWGTYSPSFVSASEPRVLYLNQTGSYANDTNVWGTSAVFNNSTFTVGDWAGSNASGQTFIAYCFADVQGYSKFGSYTGNGNVDGTFVYTGFKPAWLMVKNTATNSSWEIWDTKRNTFNPTAKSIFPDGAGAEYDYTNRVDLLSNGFKLKITDSSNTSGNSVIYMAFAEAPLVGSNGVTAKAR